MVPKAEVKLGWLYDRDDYSSVLNLDFQYDFTEKKKCLEDS